MSLPYVPADIIDEAKDRRRQGDSLEGLASRIGVSPEDLAALLGERVAKPVLQQSDEFDLWAADKLTEVL